MSGGYHGDRRGWLRRSAECPARKKVLGTGAVVDSGGRHVGLSHILPTPDALTHVAAVAHEDETGSGATWSVTAFAVCADPLPRHHRVVGYDPGQRLAAHAFCPDGTQVHGVGGYVNGAPAGTSPGRPARHWPSTRGAAGDLALLRSVGVRPDQAGPGCCGLAGDFGFTDGHYEVSQACAEQSLYPTVRSASTDTPRRRRRPLVPHPGRPGRRPHRAAHGRGPPPRAAPRLNVRRDDHEHPKEHRPPSEGQDAEDRDVGYGRGDPYRPPEDPRRGRAVPELGALLGQDVLKPGPSVVGPGARAPL